jgi:hypothetical protein
LADESRDFHHLLADESRDFHLVVSSVQFSSVIYLSLYSNKVGCIAISKYYGDRTIIDDVHNHQSTDCHITNCYT